MSISQIAKSLLLKTISDGDEDDDDLDEDGDDLDGHEDD
jgi:hypothetical protein